MWINATAKKRKTIIKIAIKTFFGVEGETKFVT